MNIQIGSLSISTGKTLDLQEKQVGSLRSVLQGIGSFRGLWPWIQETSAGGWQRNETFQVDTVLRNPTLYACVTLISDDISKLRPMIVQQDSDRVWTEVDSPAFSPVLDQPNSFQTWPDYANWYICSKLLSGNVYVLKERDDRGVVRALYVLNPFLVTPLVAPDGSVFYQLTPDSDNLNQVPDPIIVPAREIIHDRVCPLFHPLCGVSPVYAAGFPAVLGLNVRDAQDKFVTNGSRPGGVLLVPGTMKQADADAMKTEWKSSFGGDKQGDIAILTGGMSYLPMGMMTAEQSRVIELLHMTDEDIAKCFHMPRHKVGVGPDPTYTNIQAKNQDYLNDCLQQHITRFNVKHTQGLGLDNVPGKTLAFELDLDDLLLMDMAAKAEAAQKAVTSGLSFNEARFRFWDAAPVKGGESPMSQQQNFSLEALAKRDALPDPFGKTTPAPADVTSPEQKSLDLHAIKTSVRRKLLELAA